jgi:hypothetical protein
MTGTFSRLNFEVRPSPGYPVKMKNITVTVDDETYRRARIKAAERGTSVSALVKGFLGELAGSESATEELNREERALRERIRSFRAADRLRREDVHGRG